MKVVLWEQTGSPQGVRKKQLSETRLQKLMKKKALKKKAKLKKLKDEDQILRDLINASGCTVALNENAFNVFEEHTCEGGGTKTWLVPGGSEFWLIFGKDPGTFTWIEYCPYCGYRPPNLRYGWGNAKKD